MNTTRRIQRNAAPRRHENESGVLLAQFGAAALGGLTLFLAVLLTLSLGYRAVYAGRIFPGVSVAGVSLTGMRPDEAAITLSNRLSYPYSGKIVLRDGERRWVTTPAQAGLTLDSEASAQAAFRYGRSANLFASLAEQFNAANRGVNLAPVSIFDQRIAQNYLQKLAAEIDQPVREASLTVGPQLEVSAAPGQAGRTLNVDASLVMLGAQFQAFRDGEVPLVVVEEAPSLLDIQPQVEQARALLAAPFALNLPGAQQDDPGPWLISPQELAPLLRVTNSAGGPRLEVDAQQMEARLREISQAVNRARENARFTFDDASGQLQILQPAKEGRELNRAATLEAINQAIGQGQNAADLQLSITQPEVGDNASGAELGITQNVSTYTSYFRGSSAARMNNIQTAAARFHGLLVAPGETFSMGQALGDVSLDSGFSEALIIYGGRTIKGVGGGVCQVSTTLFRAVFFGGFPVVERYAHAYRVSYYEQNANGIDPNLAGLDATVYFPLVDFKFTNDTPYWMLMETYFDARNQSLTWKLYSTSDGRSVQWQTTGLQNVVAAPPPELQFNPEAGEGAFRQVDWPAEGADITVNRSVLKGDKIYFMDKFVTHYQPWRAVCEYGPGVDDPQKIAKRKNLCWVKQ
ncbi:MAG: VanW family protein [Anaerolineales bacterium]